jgi:hypothetical protein
MTHQFCIKFPKKLWGKLTAIKKDYQPMAQLIFELIEEALKTRKEK